MNANFQSGLISVAILAGGKGQRMGGRDKGLIELAGRPLIEHVMGALPEQLAHVFICVNRHHSEYARYAPVCSDSHSGFLGPLAGIASALIKTDRRWLMTVPVDSPQPPHDLAERLLQAAVTNDRRAAVAHDGERRQPLFALYQGDLARSAASALHENLAVWRWQNRIGTIEVDFSDVRSAFANLNTLDDFRRWERLQHD